jgi:hypothetical protein
MTSLEKLIRANRWRIRKDHAYASEDADGWNGAFLVPIDGDIWHILISDQLGWKHLSITNAQKKMMPSWRIMCRAKDLFYGDDEWAVQYMPAKEDNINDHPFCLHLWMSLDEQMPKPPFVFV